MDDLDLDLNVTSGSSDSSDLLNMLNFDLGDLGQNSAQNDLGGDGLDLGGALDHLGGTGLNHDLGGLDLSAMDDLDQVWKDFALGPGGGGGGAGVNGSVTSGTSGSSADIDIDKVLKDFGLSIEDLAFNEGDLGTESKLPSLAYSVLAAYIVVITVGVGGNLLVIIAVFMKSSMRNSHNFFIVSLALSDLFLCTVTLPITFWEIYYENFSWPFGDTVILCRLVLSVKVVPLFMSSMSIASIAYDRYRSVVLNDR